ncbi:MAG TPA: hypothetical protein VNA20_12410 [Frankiaceae bacterium]|nr:hypothetical protein [Frankiaceae bacterium]
MTRDRYQPSSSTVEGQLLDVADGLGRYGRRGKLLAWLWLLGLLAVGIVVAVLAFTS